MAKSGSAGKLMTEEPRRNVKPIPIRRSSVSYLIVGITQSKKLLRLSPKSILHRKSRE